MKKNIIYFILLLLTITNVYCQEKENASLKIDANLNSKSSLLAPFSYVNYSTDGETQNLTGNFTFKKNNQLFNLKLESPINSKDKSTKVASLDNLINSSVINIGTQGTIWHPDKNNDFIESVYKEYRDKYNIPADSIISYQDLSNDYKDYIDSKCWGTPFLWGVTFRFGKEDFSYVKDTATFKSEDNTKINLAFNFSFGIVLKKLTVIMFSWQLVDYYKSQSSQTYNIPFNSSGVTLSKKLSVGEPKHVSDNRLRLELKRIYGSYFGINPNINYLLKDKTISVELPFYFLNIKEGDKLKGLNGGAYIGWMSSVDNLKFSQKDISLGLFVSTTFNNLTNMIK